MVKLKNLGKSVLPSGSYKFKAMDFKVKDAPAGLLAVIDVMAIGPASQKEFHGKHTELAFSMAAAGIVKSWLLALGCDEETELPEEIWKSGDALEGFLRTTCKGAIFMAEIVKVKNKAGYENNQVEKPWDNLMEARKEDDDYEDPAGEVPF